MKTNFKLESAKSNIDWIGQKVTGSHNGTIGIREAEFIFNDGRLSDGKVVIDTTAIKILDITDADTNAQFAGHLASDDFFSSARFPEAVFVITETDSGSNGTTQITGDLTIKGITHPITFDATINAIEDRITLAGKMIIDRTKYGIKFRSGNFFVNLGDTLIYNDFQLIFHLTATIAE